MPFYLTRNPVPSADMRDVFDNAQNLDLALNNITSAIWTDRFGRSRMSWYGLESAFSLKLTDFETSFTAQLSEQANEFEAAQAAHEDSFQESLLKIGYESLPDYTDGPITFTRRNQITAYNGEFYRPKASVSLPYTTTGNTATTWETDKDNFVAVGDAALRQELFPTEKKTPQENDLQRSMFDILPSPLNLWGTAGLAFGGNDNRGILLIDEKGRLKTLSSVDGLQSGSGLMFATVENYGTQQGKFPDKVLRLPSDGLESDNTSPSVIFSYNTDGSPRLFVVNPRQYGQYGWPESGAGYDGSLLSSGIGSIYRELVWSDNARSTAFGSYEPKLIARNEGTTVQYMPLVTWDVSGATPWGGDIELLLTTSKTATYAVTGLRIRANMQLISGKTISALTAADWSRIIESYFDGPYNMLRSVDSNGAYFDAIGLGVIYNSTAGTVTLYLTLPTSGSQSGIYISPVFIGNSSKMVVNYSASRVTTIPSGLILLSNSMIWNGANSGRSNDGSIVASDIHARVSNDTTWSSTRPDILYDGYTVAGNGTVRCAFDETIKISRTGTGTYQITGMSSAWNSWKVRPPKDQSGNDLAIVEVAGSGTTLTISVYSIVYTVSGTSATRGKGVLIDIPSYSWVDVNGVN